MSKKLLAAAALAVSVGGLSAATPAIAQSSWSFSVGTGSPGYWYDRGEPYGGYYDNPYYRQQAWRERQRWEQRSTSERVQTFRPRPGSATRA